MHKGLVVAALAGIALGGLAGAGLAQDGIVRSFGFWESHVSQDRFELELGITPSGRPGLPKRQKDDRTVLMVPSHYGELFQITQNGADSVLWFRTSSGELRNTVLADSARTAWQVERTATLDREARLK